MSTIPASVVAGIVADVLAERRQRLLNRLERNPRSGSTSTAAGRQQVVDRLGDQMRAVRSMPVTGSVSAEVAGLLAAWAAGHGPAVVELEAIDPRIEPLSGNDIVEACRVLLGAK